MRIGGLASGMDVETIVKDLMKAEKMPLTKLEQSKTWLEWKRDSYREVNKLLDGLDKVIFAGVDKESKLKTKTVKSSNESLVTATASASADPITSSIKVHQLASSTTWTSNNSGVITKNFSPFAGQSIKLNVTKGDGTGAGAVEIKIENGDTLEKVLSKLNQNKTLGVSAFYDSVREKVAISKVDTGSQAAITIADSTSATLLKELGFIDSFAGGKLGEADTNMDGIADDLNGDGNTLNDTGVMTVGKDADFEFNGYRTTRASNTFTINEVTYQLHSADPTKTANLQTNINTDAIYSTIKEFVDKYNEVIEAVNKKTNEKRYRDFPPLTAEQRKAMEKEEIQMWEEKAKSGMLRNDSLVRSGLTSMRLSAYSPVKGVNTKFDTLSEIGITTSANYLTNGKLEINEDKLKAAITNNPNEVFELFNKEGTTFETKGLVDRLRENIKNTIGKIEKNAGNEFRSADQYTLGQEITRQDNRIRSFERKMADVENRYWREFTAMEKVINRYNTQFSMLTGNTNGE